MNPADVVRLRLHAQRVSATTHTRPSEVVAWLGALQAQDYLGALWGVGLRLAGARESDIEAALAEGSLVRTWPMRGTLHFVAAADARWMIDLLGPRVVARAAGRLRALGVDDTTLARARRALERSLEGGRRLTRAAVYGALEHAKVSVAGQRGIHVLWRLAHECFICFGPRQGKQHTFVLFDEWLPGAKRLPRDEALAELAQRYFRGHGPATVADFAWWSGLGASRARHAVHLAKERLVEDTDEGVSYWSSAAASSSPAPRARGYLLPAFDEFVVAYADRSAAIESAHMARVNAGGGILNPTMVVDGRIVGTWRRRLARHAVVFLPAPFAALGKTKIRAVQDALQRYADFLEVDVSAHAWPFNLPSP